MVSMEDGDVVVVDREPHIDNAFDITLIAVMGVTGSGKSNFIRLATGSNDPVVGDDLASCTCYEYVSVSII